MPTQLGSFVSGAVLTAGDLNDIATWTDYTPTFATGVTVGNGTWVAGYAIVNKILFWQGTFTLGSTSAITGDVTINVPASKTFPSPSNAEIVGNARLIAGAVVTTGIVTEATTTSVRIFALNSSTTYLSQSLLTATVPGTWTTGNSIVVSYCARIV